MGTDSGMELFWLILRSLRSLAVVAGDEKTNAHTVPTKVKRF